jgi:nucleolar protein 9
VAGSAEADQENQGLRAVPSSFAMAVRKIIQDSVSEMDATSLRVLAKHPIGNPTLQLLLELDLTLSKQDSKSEADGSDSARPTLLYQLLPGAPKSLSEETSEASEFINGMIYDQIGSRLVETLITHAPGKIFKALNQNIFLPRIQGYVRNDVSSYASIRVLNRLGKDDLVKAVDQIAPTVPQLVGKARYNVLRTLFERCSARGINDEVKRLNKGLKEGCGPEPADLIITLCCLKDEVEEKKKKDVNQLARNEYAIQSHGAQLLTTLLSIPGPLKGVQEALLSLSPELLLRLAKTSMPTVTVLTTAFATSSANPAFHKSIVAKITPHISELATSQYGHNLVNALVEVPSKGKERSIPFHMKEAIMSQLGQHESELRDCWMGRSVWRSWKGDMWKTRRGDWKIWMREVDALVEQKPSVGKNGLSSANSVAVEARRDRASQNDEEKGAPQEPELISEQIPEVIMEDVVEEAAEEAAEETAEKPKKKKKKKKKDKDGKEKKSKKAKKDDDEE